MMDYFKEIDFTQEIQENYKLEEYIKKAISDLLEEFEKDDIKKPLLENNKNKSIIGKQIQLVQGLPRSPKEKINTIQKVFEQRFLPQLQILENYCGMDIEIDETNEEMTGTIIMHFNTLECANEALIKLDNFLVMNKYQLKTTSMNEFQQKLQTINQFQIPKYMPKSQHLTVSEYKEQFAILTNKQLSFKWFDHLEVVATPISDKPDQDVQKEFKKGFWSPFGTYFVLQFQNLFGGPNMDPLNVFNHEGVQQVVFSPNEELLMSYNGDIDCQMSRDVSFQLKNLIIWQTDSGFIVKTFLVHKDQKFQDFQFSYCSRYFSAADQHNIIVYELPLATSSLDFKMKSILTIQSPDLQKYIWLNFAPTIISIGQGQNQQKQSKVLLTDVPSGNQLRQWKSIVFQVNDFDIISSFQKDWIALIIQKRIKKSLQTIVHLANFNSKNFEISDFDLQTKYSSITHEPNTGKFCFATDEEDPSLGKRKTFRIYAIDREKFQLQEIAVMKQTLFTDCYFSSNGEFFVLVNIQIGNAHRGLIEFFTIKQTDKQFRVKKLKEEKMIYMTSCAWDPSGKLLLTSSNDTKSYIIWNSFGKTIFKDTILLDISYLAWRPRPNLLSEINKKRMEDIQKNFAKIQKNYEEQDDKILNKAKHEKEAKLQQMKLEFITYLQKMRKVYDETRTERINLLGFDEEACKTEDLIVEMEIVKDSKEL